MIASPPSTAESPPSTRETQPSPIWNLPIASVYLFLETSPEGLPTDEAQRRFEKFGANELPEPPSRPLWLRFADQLTHFMALLLWVAGVLAFVSGTPALGWAIWAVILVNAIFSFSQEFQAERALSALKNVLPQQASVYRLGELIKIPTRELVRGDVVQLEAGDRISADARLVSAEGLSIDVSILTGESLPVTRNAYPVSLRESIPVRGEQMLTRAGEHPLHETVNPAEKTNLVLAGSTVSVGRGVAVVYATGAQTEFGHVAHLTTAVKREPSTLEVQVTQIVRVISAIALTMVGLVFALTSLLIGIEIKESFIFAIGIIVALVPEGLLPTVTLALAIGVRRMAKQNALVRRLSAVESLSATTVICTDKTGTLTKNEMTVCQIWLPSVSNDQQSFLEISGAGYDPTAGKIEMPASMENPWQVQLLLAGAALCSNAKLVHLEAPSRWQEIGDPTEAALMVAAAKSGLNVETLQKQTPRLREIPFDSRRMMMSVVLNWQRSELMARR